MREPVWLGCGLVFGVAAVLGIVWNRHASYRESHESKPLVFIAMIGQNRDAHVKELFGANRILVVTWGGSHSGQWVEVPEGQAAQAIQLLHQDAKEHRYYVHFGDRHPSRCTEEPWIVPPANAPYSEMLTRPEYSKATVVGACLRLPEVADVARTYPRISRVRYFKRHLLEASEASPLLEELCIENFVEPSGGKGRDTTFQIFREVETVHCVGDVERDSR